ncbi:MAG: PucR family transcriptional regulator ligand-binding domain-containing protein [Bacillota bacterium]|nr:PucR family transcriptional regulator ligand-binding domain-containing protein [Bacillota bacterium]
MRMTIWTILMILEGKTKMKVTVSDCLSLDLFKNAKVLVGGEGLKDNVEAVSVLDPCETSDFNLVSGGKNEIILTGFLGMRKNVNKQVAFIKALGKKNCAALFIFFAGRGLEKISPEIIMAAESAKLPLILMAPEIEYSEAITEIMDNLLYGENFGNSLISNTIFHLLNFEKHSNFQSAVREAAINNDFQVTILSEDFNPVLVVETRHKVSLTDAIRIGRERNLSGDTNKVYTLIDVEGTLTYWGLVNIGSDRYYMIIVDNEDSYTPGEITKLAEIIELAMGMWKYTPERDAKSEFIKALIRGNKSLAYTLQDEAKIIGTEIVGVFFTKGVDQEVSTHHFAADKRQLGYDPRAKAMRSACK